MSLTEGITTWCGTAERGVIHLSRADPEEILTQPVPTLCGRTLRLLPLSLKSEGDKPCRNCMKSLWATPPPRRAPLHQTAVTPARYV